MRAIALLMLCVVLLAAMQASYIVVEANRESHIPRVREPRAAEAQDGSDDVNQGTEEKPDDEDDSLTLNTDVSTDNEGQVQEVVPEMQVDQPLKRVERVDNSDRRKERNNRKEKKKEKKLKRKGNKKKKKEKKKDKKEVKKTERKEKRKQNREKKEEKKQRKSEKKDDKTKEEKRNSRKVNKAERKQKKAVRQEKKAGRKEKKEKRKEMKEEKKSERRAMTHCEFDEDCQGEGMCCIPKRNHHPISQETRMLCHPKKEQGDGQKCRSDCMCGQGFRCKVSGNNSGAQKSNKAHGRCVSVTSAAADSNFLSYSKIPVPVL